MRTKIIMKYHFTPVRPAKTKMTTLHGSKDRDELGLACGTIILKTVPYRVKHTSNVYPRISTLKYSLKTYKNICPQEGLYKNVHREQPKCPSNRRINKQTEIYNEILLSNKRTHHWHNNINESQKHHVEWKEPDTKTHTLYDPCTHSSRTGKSDLGGQKPRAAGCPCGMGATAKGRQGEEVIWGEGHVLHLDWGKGRTGTHGI